MEFDLINTSKKHSDQALLLDQVAAAIQAQVQRDVPALWKEQMGGHLVKHVVGQPNAGAFPVYLIDNPDVANALGYHDELKGGKPYARIFLDPVFNNGGTPTTGPLSVSSVVSHEVLEALIDTSCNWWADHNTRQQVALEVCDPTQEQDYPINGVQVSNFVGPAWFDPKAAHGSVFDFRSQLHGPFTYGPKGYLIVRNLTTGKVGTVGAEHLSATAVASKRHPASRTFRRGVRL